MTTIINAADAIKYAETPLFLQCKTTQDIIIRDVPSIATATIREKLGYETDSSGNGFFSFKKGGSRLNDVDGNNNGNADVNDLFDLQITYLKKEKLWKITIGIEYKDVKSCEIKKLKLSIPIAVPDVFDFKVAFACQANLQCIEAMLAIDLGNTRSCALLCNDIRNITHHGGIQMHKVPLCSYMDNRISDIGVFDSYVSFSEISGVSFTRIGKEAIPVANTLRYLKGGGDFYLSSPKRYFWDNDENLNGWKVLHNGQNTIPLRKIPIAKTLASISGSDVDTLPRSAILASMLIEILEQAETYINSANFFSTSTLPKVISNVCVTFPAGWSEQERKRYNDVLQSAVDAYRAQRCNTSTPITLDVTCDEATAVLLCYIYGEIAKYSGFADTWLKAIGRTSLYNTETHARIAVIDVGGGTSDLVIVNVQNKKSETGLNLQIDKLYKDGTNKAGDLLLQKVTEQILVEKIAAGTIASNAPKNIKASYVAQFSQRLNTLSTDVRVKQLTRRFWFPLAIDFITKINHGESVMGLPDSFSLLLEIIKDYPEWTGNNINEDLREITITDADRRLFDKIVITTFRETANLFGSAIYAFDADIVILSGKTTETEQVSQVFQKYCYLPDSRFITMWNYMIGDWCSVADAGKINDSKYTTAIGAVLYDIVNHNFPIQSLEASIHTQNAQGLNDGNCLWGIANNGYFFASDAILKPDCNENWISFSGRPKLIARRRFGVDASEIAISYELRFKPFKQRVQEWKQLYQNYLASKAENFVIKCDDIDAEDFLIEIKNDKPLKTPKVAVTVGFNDTDDTKTSLAIIAVDGLYEDGTPVSKDDILLRQKPQDRLPDGNINVKLLLQTDSNSRATISIAEVNGKYSDGALVNKEDLEIRIRTSSEDLFWLDSGKI